jgi:hypothetical protein
MKRGRVHDEFGARSRQIRVVHVYFALTNQITSDRLTSLRDQVDQLMAFYPRIYFACHTRHVPDPRRNRVLSSHQASVLDHLDEIQSTGLLTLAAHMGVTASTSR